MFLWFGFNRANEYHINTAFGRYLFHIMCGNLHWYKLKAQIKSGKEIKTSANIIQTCFEACNAVFHAFTYFYALALSNGDFSCCFCHIWTTPQTQVAKRRSAEKVKFPGYSTRMPLNAKPLQFQCTLRIHNNYQLWPIWLLIWIACFLSFAHT